MDTEAFVESMDLALVIAWANVLGVEHNEKSWLDDEYPDKESDLRVRLATAIARVGEDA